MMILGRELVVCLQTIHEECLKHHGAQGAPAVTPWTCGAVGDRAQVMLIWVKAPGVRNTSYPQRLGVMRVRP